MDNILIDAGGGLCIFGAGALTSFLFEVPWRSRMIAELRNRHDELAEDLRRAVASRNKARTQLVETHDALTEARVELAKLKATAIVRDAKGHFIKAKA